MPHCDLQRKETALTAICNGRRVGQWQVHDSKASMPPVSIKVAGLALHDSSCRNVAEQCKLHDLIFAMARYGHNWLSCTIVCSPREETATTTHSKTQ